MDVPCTYFGCDARPRDGSYRDEGNDSRERLSPRKGCGRERAAGEGAGQSRPCPWPMADGRRACISCCITQLLLDTNELVVLGDAVRARQRAGLDLAGVGG